MKLVDDVKWYSIEPRHMATYDHTYISLLIQSSTFTVFVYQNIIFLAVNSTLFWITLDTDLNLYIMTDKYPS